ncbi:MAG: DNA repair exonuclease [Clostridia bacterium]|nr:DNA repair exonuclease [Clostridia bacterium]
MKILHCADVHIGAAERFLGAAAESRRYETLMTFERITQIARENAVDVLLIAGDLFDGNRIEQSLIDRTFKALGDLSPIRVLIAAGNHDPLSADSPYKTALPDNVRVFGGKAGVVQFDEFKTRVYGQSFTGVYMTGEGRFPIVPPQDDYCNILLLHGDLGDGRSDYNGISTDFLAQSGMDYVALGHIHARSEVLRIGATHYAYPGCPEGQGFDELGAKGVYLGTVEKGKVDLEFLPVCRRQHLCVTVDVSDCNDPAAIAPMILDKLNTEYGEDYRENLYKIILNGAVGEDFSVPADEITSRLNEALYFAKVSDETTVKIDLENLAQEDTLKGVFVRQLLSLRQTVSAEQQEAVDRALAIGLKAFSSEVKYRDDQ